MKFEPTGTIDFEAIRTAVDIRRFVESDLGPPLRYKRWPCPIHGGESPNFGITPDGRHAKCWTCGWSGDVVDYYAAREGIDLAKAARQLDPSAGQRVTRPARPSPARQAAPQRAGAWRDARWQGAVDRIVHGAAETLWRPTGRQALDWLRARGLDDQTIRRFRLGFIPSPLESDPLEALADDSGPRPIRVDRGITIPWVAPGGWYDSTDGPLDLRWVGCNVRRLAADFGNPEPKYRALAGSERGHGYPWPEASMPGEPAIVTEGELDSLTAWQEFGWVANVTTFGGAGQGHGHQDARAFLAACPDWLLLFDQDEAGDKAAAEFTRHAPHRCRRLRLPGGTNDLNDLHRSGTRVLDWLRSEWSRFGWNVRLDTEPGIIIA
jgi:DNA primase